MLCVHERGCKIWQEAGGLGCATEAAAVASPPNFCGSASDGTLRGCRGSGLSSSEFVRYETEGARLYLNA